MNVAATLEAIVNMWPALALGVGAYVGVRVDLARLYERSAQALTVAQEARAEAQAARLEAARGRA